MENRSEACREEYLERVKNFHFDGHPMNEKLCSLKKHEHNSRYPNAY